MAQKWQSALVWLDMKYFEKWKYKWTPVTMQ